MDWFHIIVLTIALVVLILLLTFIGILMSNQKKTMTYPPTYNTCPDYWSVSTDGSNCVIPTYDSQLNIGSLYTSPGVLSQTVLNTPGFTSPKDVATNAIINQINFGNSNWQGSVCNQKIWANNNNIVWDGVSNYNSC
jgi:hypothetical protein